MTFLDIPAGASVFLEANVLVYHFTADPQFGPPCTDLIRRIEQQEIVGFELLSGDGLIVAVLQANGLTHLASQDADFDRVPGIIRYAPS
jgi:predicted nucleic acid-binding protein